MRKSDFYLDKKAIYLFIYNFFYQGYRLKICIPKVQNKIIANNL